MTDKVYAEIFDMLNKAKQSGSHLMILPLRCACGCNFFYPTLGELTEHNPQDYIEIETECPRCGREHEVYIKHTGLDEED